MVQVKVQNSTYQKMRHVDLTEFMTWRWAINDIFWLRSADDFFPPHAAQIPFNDITCVFYLHFDIATQQVTTQLSHHRHEVFIIILNLCVVRDNPINRMICSTSRRHVCLDIKEGKRENSFSQIQYYYYFSFELWDLLWISFVQRKSCFYWTSLRYTRTALL